MTAIVFAHPWHGSFNKAILDTITTKYDKLKKEYRVIDLNKDNFNPVLTEKELSLYSKGKSVDPLVDKYKKIIRDSDEIIFIFPIWWGTMPAILKGFFDKVLLLDFAYNYDGGWNPLLKNLKKAMVITTSQSPESMFRNSIENEFCKNILESIGIENAIWINNDETAHGNNEKRIDFLKQMEEQA